MMQYSQGQNALVLDLERDDSDCEDDSPGTKDELPNEDQTRAVLATGSFSAYACFLSSRSREK